MLDVGWTELLLIGVVALIVVGPKDLPVMFHTLGRITARARGMAREFSSAMEDAAKASGVHEVGKDLRDLQKLTSPRAMGLDALSRAADKFEKWDPLEPVRDGAPVPDPAAPPPAAQPTALAAPVPAASAPPTTPTPAAATAIAPASAGAAIAPAGTAVAATAAAPAAAVPDAGAMSRPTAAPGATASGLSLGLGSPLTDAPAAGADQPAHPPGARRLHAVRRTDRS